jgi:hypothetical protein
MASNKQERISKIRPIWLCNLPIFHFGVGSDGLLGLPRINKTMLQRVFNLQIHRRGPEIINLHFFPFFKLKVNQQSKRLRPTLLRSNRKIIWCENSDTGDLRWRTGTSMKESTICTLGNTSIECLCQFYLLVCSYHPG